VLESCEYRWSVLTTDWEGSTYAVERGELFGVFFMWDTSPSARVPLNVIRSVYEALQLGPDLFETKH